MGTAVSEVDVEEIHASPLSVLETQTRGEIDMQIATAKRWPRSIKAFKQTAMEMATLDEQTAEACIYALPRAGKTIEGPSARFAEIVLSAWGNSRAGARTMSDEGNFVVAQGAFHDLERNVAINFEVRRRITNQQGRRYNDDMIGTTANAACSIALRNAVLKGIPKAFWSPIYDAARKTAVGDAKTLASRRADMLGYFQKLGASNERVFGLLGVKGADDITLDHLFTLKGLATAIKEGDTTVDDAFAAQANGDAKTKATTVSEIVGETPDVTETTKPAEEKPKSKKPALEPPLCGEASPAWPRFKKLQDVLGHEKARVAKEEKGWLNLPFTVLTSEQLDAVCDLLEQKHCQ